jgi:hypothetical protein
MHPHANDERPRARIEEDPMNRETPWTDGALALPVERGVQTARAPPHAGMRAPTPVTGPHSAPDVPAWLGALQALSPGIRADYGTTRLVGITSLLGTHMRGASFHQMFAFWIQYLYPNLMCALRNLPDVCTVL